MKFVFGRIFFVFAALMIFNLPVFSQAEKDTRNVLDYYKLLPENMLDDEAAKAKITIQDTKNGYLKIEGLFEGWVEAALFRKKNGSPVLVVGSTGCGPVCETDVTAYEFSGGKLVNETERILPKLSDEQIIKIYNERKTDGDEDTEGEPVSQVYELPRIGTVIKIKADTTLAPSNILLYELHWKDDKFIVVR